VRWSFSTRRAHCRQFDLHSGDGDSASGRPYDRHPLELVLFTSEHCPLCDGLRTPVSPLSIFSFGNLGACDSLPH
jgi:hypothetical protein